MKPKNLFGRYCVPSDESFEPGSNEEVLKNYLGIKDLETITALEEQELKRAELEIITIFDRNHQFAASDICDIHELWLGDIYPSAGKYRTVNMSKERFQFAAAMQIDFSMQTFEEKYLTRYTPCQETNIDLLAYALGVVHVEFIIIHPFREGNGRTARILADLMAIQANKPPLNYNSIDRTIDEEGFKQYIKAIHAGVNEEYVPIQNIFRRLLEQSKP